MLGNIKIAAHVVSDCYLAAAPNDLFDIAGVKQLIAECLIVLVRLYRLPSRPVRPQEVSGSLMPAPSPEGVGIASPRPLFLDAAMKGDES